MFLELLWMGVYLKSPYLFPGIASVLYLFDLDRFFFQGSLDTLVAFPISLYYTSQGLWSGQRPRHPEVITIEFIRWLTLLFFPYDGFRSVMVGYSYGVFTSLVLESYELSRERQLKFKFAWYLFWLGVLIVKFWPDPFVILLHGLNFLCEVKSVSVLMREDVSESGMFTQQISN